MIRLMVAAALLFISQLQLAAPALAKPPDNADPALAPWFQGLRQPGTGISCCSIADCRPADYRITHDRYEAFIGGAWRDVPPERVLHRDDNPTGRAVVCWTPSTGVMCFIKGPEI